MDRSLLLIFGSQVRSLASVAMSTLQTHAREQRPARIMRSPSPRIIFELGTLVNAKGHNDGITRSVRNFQRYAAEHRADVVFAVYDLQDNIYRSVQAAIIPEILAGAKVDTSHIADPFALKRRFRERLPEPLRRIALVIQRPRRRAFLLTERIRLSLAQPSSALARLQEWLLSDKYRAELSDGKGGRRTLLPYDMAITTPLIPKTNDIALFVGADFPAMRACALRRAEPNSPRMVVLCYDIIALMFSQFFTPQDSRRFAACFHAVFPAADLTILTSQCIERDVRAYCAEHGLGLKRTAVVPLGADVTPPSGSETAALPDGLQPGKFALFVSTIEPRKNHRLLFSVWQRLLAAGIPQAHDFKLVFVGRPGWLTEDLMKEMKADPGFGNNLLVLSDINDESLHRLYSDAAFCLYPSFYEGFGLPIIEAFRYGKAVIASTGGSLPEVVEGFSPCLDPHDVDGWYDEMKTWIEDPAVPARYEVAIRRDFKARDWTSAAQYLFETIDREFLLTSPGNQSDAGS